MMRKDTPRDTDPQEDPLLPAPLREAPLSPPAFRGLPLGKAARTPGERAESLLEDFLKGRSPDTERTYRDAILRFAAFVGASGPEEASQKLILLTQGEANEVVMLWKNAMLEEGKAPATINVRLAAIRSLVERANLIGLVPWSIRVKNVEAKSYRDTSGPGTTTTRELLQNAAAQENTFAAARDSAILHLLYDQALRRVEVARLDLAHLLLDDAQPFLWVRGKGKRESERIYLSAAAVLALKNWLKTRGDWPGPLFHPQNRKTRLSRSALNEIVAKVTPEGARATPHGLRHTSITVVVEKAGVREGQKHSRHAKLDTLMIYDDNRKKKSAAPAEAASAALNEPLTQPADPGILSPTDKETKPDASKPPKKRR